MAEIGLIASVVQVAGAGLKLSHTLYQYVDGVATADRRIKDIATEIRLTSFIIEELGNVFRSDETKALVSKGALKTADETMKECSDVFAEIDATLKKSKKNTFGRLMLPFRDTKIELLRSHIDKLKDTLTLLLGVLSVAHHVATQKLDRKAEAEAKAQIQELIELRKKSAKKYEESLKNFSMSDGSSPTLLDDADAEAGEETVQVKAANVDPSAHISVMSIASSINPNTLETCVHHVRSLLGSIETLQQALTDAVDGSDHSAHHQSLVDSYFRARSHLDGVILSGSSQQGATTDNHKAPHHGLTGFREDLDTKSLESVVVHSGAASTGGSDDDIPQDGPIPGLGSWNYDIPQDRPLDHFSKTPLRLSPRYEHCRGLSLSHLITEDVTSTANTVPNTSDSFDRPTEMNLRNQSLDNGVTRNRRPTAASARPPALGSRRALLRRPKRLELTGRANKTMKSSDTNHEHDETEQSEKHTYLNKLARPTDTSSNLQTQTPARRKPTKRRPESAGARQGTEFSIKDASEESEEEEHSIHTGNIVDRTPAPAPESITVDASEGPAWSSTTTTTTTFTEVNALLKQWTTISHPSITHTAH